MSEERFTLIEACDKAAEIIAQSSHLDRLYRKALRTLGEGELRNAILEVVTNAIEDEALRDEVFASDDSMLGFFLGVWIQFLLIEIAGMKKERLRTLAQKMFTEIQREKSLH